MKVIGNAGSLRVALAFAAHSDETPLTTSLDSLQDFPQ